MITETETKDLYHTIKAEDLRKIFADVKADEYRPLHDWACRKW